MEWWIDDRYVLWRWYYSPSKYLVYHRIPNGYQIYNCHRILGIHGHYPIFCDAKNITRLPSHAHRASCVNSPISTHLTGWLLEKVTITPAPTTTPSLRPLASTPSPWIIETYYYTNKGLDIADSSQQGLKHIVCDGAFDRIALYGAASYVINP